MKQIKWTNEDRSTIEFLIQDIKQLMDRASDEDKFIYEKELALLDKFNSILRNKPENPEEEITLIEGQRYKCIRTAYYDEGNEMFTKGNVYIALQDKYGRGLGLMSNDGIVRTKRDIPEELVTAYFELVNE